MGNYNGRRNGPLYNWISVATLMDLGLRHWDCRQSSHPFQFLVAWCIPDVFAWHKWLRHEPFKNNDEFEVKVVIITL